IGEVIGPKGKRINEIIALTGADINIEDDGRVFIGSREGEGAQQAVHMIEEIANPRPIEVGERYDGTVVKTTTFGAFVNITRGRGDRDRGDRDRGGRDRDRGGFRPRRDRGERGERFGGDRAPRGEGGGGERLDP